MIIAMATALGFALVLLGLTYLVRRQRRRNPFTTRARLIVEPLKRLVMPNAGSTLVFVNEDGSVRELTDDDKKYVDTEFSPFDGARPYLKLHYSDRNGFGSLRGYLPRDEVPAGVPIGPAPASMPPRPQSPGTVADSIMELVRRHNSK